MYVEVGEYAVNLELQWHNHRPEMVLQRSVKPSAQPTLVRTQHLPHQQRQAPDQCEHGQGLVLSYAVACGLRRSRAAVHAQAQRPSVTVNAVRHGGGSGRIRTTRCGGRALASSTQQRTCRCSRKIRFPEDASRVHEWPGCVPGAVPRRQAARGSRAGLLWLPREGPGLGIGRHPGMSQAAIKRPLPAGKAPGAARVYPS